MKQHTHCSIDGCGRPAEARGWCGRHYQRWLKYGDANAPVREKRSRPVTPQSIIYLKPGDAVPTTTPKRYKNVHGYIVLRWRVGVRAYVETLEHRVVNGRVTEAPHVHHADHNRANNCPENLVHVDPTTHRHLHRSTPRADAVRLYESGFNTIQVAEALGTYPGNISRILRQEGVTMRKVNPNRQTHFDAAAVARDYGQGVRTPEVCARHGISRTVLTRVLKEQGVPPRRAGRPKENP